MNSLAEEYLIKFQSRIPKPLELIDFVDKLENHEILQIIRELCMHPESFSLIRHEGLAYLTSAYLVKNGGVPIVKKSWSKRLRGILKR